MLLVTTSIVLLTAACGSSDSTGAGETTTTAADTSAPDPTSTQPVSEASASPEPITSEPVTSEPVTSEPAPVDSAASNVDFDSLAACVTGDWTMISDEVEDIFRDSAIASVPGMEVSVDGEGALTMAADGTYSYVPAFTATVSLLDTTGAGTWSGSLLGSWSLDGDTLTMTQTSNDISGTIAIMGSTQPMPDIAVFAGTGTVVDCNPATMEIRLDTPEIGRASCRERVCSTV